MWMVKSAGVVGNLRSLGNFSRFTIVTLSPYLGVSHAGAESSVERHFPEEDGKTVLDIIFVDIAIVERVFKGSLDQEGVCR